MSGTIVDQLTSVAQDITLGVQVEGLLVPFLTATIKEVKSLSDTGTTMDYNLVLSIGKGELATATTNFQNVLDKVNAERTRLGLPPIQGING